MLDSAKLGESPIRLLVADGSRIHTRLLSESLRRDPAFLVLPFELEATRLASALQAQAIDVLLMSAALDAQAGRGFEVLRELRAVMPQLRAVMLLDSSSDDAILAAFRAGARGVISKSDPPENLNDCLRCVHQGHIWADHRQMTIALEALAAAPVVRAVNAKGMNLLSQRELQIVRSLAEGLTNREIAERLKLSQHTVKNYLFRVFDKMGVSSRMELLFMTLADSDSEASSISNKRKPSREKKIEDDFGKILKAADESSPVPQRALDEMYLQLRKQTPDLIRAYACYLLAADQLLHAKETMGSSMTVHEIEQAQRQAHDWIESLPPSRPVPRATETPDPTRRGGYSQHSSPTPKQASGVKPSGVKQSAKAKAAYL